MRRFANNTSSSGSEDLIAVVHMAIYAISESGATLVSSGAVWLEEAALTAKRCDVVIAFGIRVEGEGFDMPDLSLPWGQDAVIDAVASASANTIVVLETGNPVSMPWRDKVKAIVQAWYSGQAGGQAIAEVLAGTVNPAGRLPITFPASSTRPRGPSWRGLARRGAARSRSSTTRARRWVIAGSR